MPGNTTESYKLALRIFFKAFTQKLQMDAEYPDFRMATLASAIELGYPVGSHVYKQLENAWSAVGVENTYYDKICTKTTAQSLGNGTVTINTQQGTLFPDPQSLKVSLLHDCLSYNPVGTYLSGSATGFGTSLGNTNVYSGDGDLFKSKVMVSVHHFTQVARDWFFGKLNLDGMNGKGQFTIKNEFTDLPNKSVEYTTQGANPVAKFYYNYTSLSACRDLISKNYFRGVNFFNKYDQIQVVPSTEWSTITTALSEIFSLEIKKDYEISLQNAGANNIWTLFEEAPDPLLSRSFSAPKVYGQPAVYYGTNWNNANPSNNSGIINLCYYLLVHGSDADEDYTNGDEGYKNDEPNSEIYFVNKLDKSLVLKVFWNAYKESATTSTVEEFHQATLKALHNMGMQYDGKSKEHIAFYDAWAAVLGLPDYTSTLDYEPVTGTTPYPWTVKVGAEVEYPLYESERLFEVSKSDKFNPNEFPVHQFVSNAAPDQATSMVYGLVNLEPGQTYHIRSRLSNAGDPRDGCAVTPDPAFCEALKAKVKWTIPYEFKTKAVAMVSNVTPVDGEQIPAWGSPFSWVGVPGARGGAINITDNVLTMSSHIFPIESFYDADQTTAVTQATLALSKEKKYTHSVAPYQKLGSEWAVHVLPNGSLLSFTDDEITALPYVYGPWTPEVMFETDLPKIVPGAVPANGEHISLLAPPFTLTAGKIDRADQYQFEYKEPYYKQAAMPEPVFDFLISNVPAITDLQQIKWAFTPVRKADTLFIPQDETGATEWRSFVADMGLVPKPVINFIGQICFNNGEPVSLSWEKVDFATHYHYVVKEEGTGTIVAEATTDKLTTPPIANASKYPAPGKYVFEVSAGYKNTEGQFFFGPKASVTYGVRPPAPTALSPDANNNVPLNPGNNITFKWQAGNGNVTDTHSFSLFKETDNGAEAVDGFGQASILGDQITVPGLEFNTNYIWRVNNHSSASGCGSLFSNASFKTEDEPIVPELTLGFQIFVKDDWDLPDFGLQYHITVHKPGGEVVFDQQNVSSNIPLSKILPAHSGKYKIDVLVNKVTDTIKSYKKNPAYGISVVLWDKGIANQQLDSDTQLGEFAPVLNAQLHLSFDYDATSNTLSH